MLRSMDDVRRQTLPNGDHRHIWRQSSPAYSPSFTIRDAKEKKKIESKYEKNLPPPSSSAAESVSRVVLSI